MESCAKQEPPRSRANETSNDRSHVEAPDMNPSLNESTQAGTTSQPTLHSIEEFASSQPDQDWDIQSPPSSIHFPSLDTQSCTSSVTTTQFRNADLYVSSMYPSTQGLEEDAANDCALQLMDEGDRGPSNVVEAETLVSMEANTLQKVNIDSGAAAEDHQIELSVLKSETKAAQGNTDRTTTDQYAIRDSSQSQATGVFARVMGFTNASNNPIVDPRREQEPTRPGAYPISFPIAAYPIPLSSGSQPFPNQQESNSHPSGTSTSSLVEATPLSLPIASPYSMDSQQVGLRKDDKARAKRLLLVLMVALCLAVGLAARFHTISIFAPKPADIRKARIKESILSTFGTDYFDSEPKAKSLHWILYEDPLQELAVQFDSEAGGIDLIQRFSLVAFYFQTSHQQPWKNCNPREGLQPDLCYFDRGDRLAEEQAMRWLSATHECQWMGVLCEHGSKTVSTLRINYCNISSTIPSELSHLSHIKVLDLGSNSFCGTLPHWLGELTTIKGLYLRDNHLSGSIPPSYFSSPSLSTLLLSSNLLTGPIPAQIGSYGGVMLSLSQNLLTGSIPEHIFSMKSIQWIFLGNNLIKGTLSTRVGELSNLTILDLGESDGLHGLLPSEIGKLTKLTDLRVAQTSIAGTLPEELFAAASLQTLVLSNNQISGTISHKLGQLTKLWTFDIDHNNMEGQIPSEVKQMTDLHHLGINGNKNLTGSIPMEFCSHLGPRAEIVADCTPMKSTGLPAIVCPKGCCNMCCDAETKICTEK